MENSVQALEWLRAFSKYYGIKITRFTWPKAFGLELSDVEVSAEIDSETFVGRGTNRSLPLATLKALNEFVERYTCFASGLVSTEGTACHQSLESAILKSRLEFAERQLAHQPDIVKGPWRAQSPSVLLKSFAEIPGLEVYTLSQEISDGKVLFMSVALGDRLESKKFGAAIGISFNMEHAEMEMARNTSHLLTAGPDEDLLQTNPWLTTASAQNFRKFLKSPLRVPKPLNMMDYSPRHFQQLEIPFNSFPGFVVHSFNEPVATPKEWIFPHPEKVAGWV